MSTIGTRLKEERQRVGLNQDDFAAHGGVKKRAQISYEQDERSPDAEYLAAVAAKAGVDVLYVLTGKLANVTLTDDETELLVGYRKMDIRAKAGALGMIGGFNAPAPVFHGPVGQNIYGDVTAPNTVNMPVGKSSKE